jgi:hypothetical protein
MDIPAGSFVKDHNSRGPQHRTSKAEQLPLPVGEMKLLDGRVKTSLGLDNVPQLHGSDGIGDDLVRGQPLAVSIEAHAATLNEESVLRHADESVTHLLAGQRAYVEPIHCDTTSVQVNHAEQA